MVHICLVVDDVLTPLHDATKRGNVELVRNCLNNKVDQAKVFLTEYSSL